MLEKTREVAQLADTLWLSKVLILDFFLAACREAQEAPLKIRQKSFITLK